MFRGAFRTSPSHDRRWLRRLGPVGLAFALVAAPLALLPLAAHAAEGEPEVTLQSGVNGCNGVLPNSGSENTTKRLDPNFASNFNPGGTVGYIIDYPVDETDVSGRTTFVITDCVFVNGTAIAKYSVAFVPNTVEYQLRFSVPIPADTALGAQFCNYAKTTAAPSESQASNRKAGPACFTVGGGLRIEKRSGSTPGPLLPGASFSVVCRPADTQPPTIITGLSQTSQTNSNGTVTASGVSANGTIAIVGPSGTPCTVTETAAPAGYQLDATPRNLVIPVGTSQTINVFVNLQFGSLTVSKTTSGGSGTFTFTVDCDGDGNDTVITLTDTESETVTGIPTGTSCTVTEAVDPLFTSVVVSASNTVVIDANGETVSFTNTRKVGSLTVVKTTNGGTGSFTFDADCDGTAFDQTVEIRNSGSATISGIPTTTSCTVTERDNPLFSSIVIPEDGTVEITAQSQTVAFTNTRNTGPLTITKAAIGGTGTFTFDVDCSGNTFDQVVAIQAGASATITGIPTTTSCTVTERESPLFTTSVLPANGTVSIDAAGENVAFVNTAKPSGLTIDKKVNGGDHATVEDALLVHAGDTLSYTVVITNNGQVPLTITAMSDSLYPNLIAACPQAVGSVLTVGASFTCRYGVGAIVDARNVVAVSAVDGLGRPVTGSDGTYVDVLNPAITVLKTADPMSISVSGPVTYSYVVTNTGDTTLRDILVIDDIIGTIGRIPELAAGESVTLTKTVNVDASTPPNNVGTVTGTDVLGQMVTASDRETITVVSGAVVLGAVAVPAVQPAVQPAIQPAVQAAVQPGVELPRTGALLWSQARAGVFLLQIGLVLTLLGRHRRRLHPQG